MNQEIKPIDWDSLPKVWAFDNEKKYGVEGVLIANNKNSHHPYVILTLSMSEPFLPHFDEYKNVTQADPRPKKRMRTMTAEELNDIYFDCGKYFRVKYFNEAIGCIPIFDLGSDLSNMEYSTDRGDTWNSCEVEE
jgi:hypothetical protein